jgi:hypothetical protein
MKSDKRVYKFATEKKQNSVNPEKTKFNSNEFFSWPEKYQDKEIKSVPEEIKSVPEEIKSVPEEIEEIEEENEPKCAIALKAKDSKKKDMVYQFDRLFFTIANKFGCISKEWLIEELRPKINTLDNQKEKDDKKEETTRKPWFMVCEESYATGVGTHFHVFIFLTKRKKKTLFQLLEHFQLTNDKVTVKPFIKKVEGKDWYFVIKYMLKEDKTPFCSLGSGNLLTWMNIVSGEKGDTELKKAVYSVIEESVFLSKEDIKSKEDLRAEVTKTTTDPNKSVEVIIGSPKRRTTEIERLESESDFLGRLVRGSYHFSCSNPLRINYLEDLIKKYFNLGFIGRLSPYLTPSLSEIKETLAEMDKAGVFVLTMTGYSTSSGLDRGLIISLLTEIQRYQEKYEKVEFMLFFCTDDMRFRKYISGMLGNSVIFIDKNFKLLTNTDVMKPDIQINLNGGDVNNNYYGLEKKELSNLKNEIREELRQELIVELTTKITNEVKLNLLAEVKADIWKDLSSRFILNK